MLCVFFGFGDWWCEHKSWSWGSFGSFYPYVGSGGDILQAWIRYWLGWCITTRKTRNVIQGCGQGKWKSYFAQVPVLVSPWSDIRITVLLLVFIQPKQVLFLGQLLIYTSTTYIKRLPRSPAPSRVLCSFMCRSTYFTFWFFFFFL